MNTLCGDTETVLYTVGLVVLLIFRQEALSLVGLLRSSLTRKACKKKIPKIGVSPPQQQMKLDESIYRYDSTPPDLEPTPCDESHEFALDDSTAQTPSPYDESHEFASDISISQIEGKLESVLTCSLSGSSCDKESISSPVQSDATSSGTPIQHRRTLRRPLLKRQVPERKLETRVASAMAMRVKSRLQRQSLVLSKMNTPGSRQQQRATSIDSAAEEEAKTAGFHEHRRSISMDSVMEDESMSSPVRSLAETQARSTESDSSPRGPALASQSIHGSPVRSLTSQSMHESPTRSLVKRLVRGNQSGSGYQQFSTEGTPSRNELQPSRSCHGGVQRSKSGTDDSTGKPVTRGPRTNRRMSVSDERMLLRMRSSSP
jgi:hypothetical protein